MERKNLTIKRISILKKMLCFITIAAMMAAWTPSAVLADTGSPAEIQDSYDINGVHYFKIATRNFTESERNFLEDILSTKDEVLGGAIISMGSQTFDIRHNSFQNWNLISREIWKNAASHPGEGTITEVLRGHITDELPEDMYDQPMNHIGSTALSSADNIKQAESLILGKLSRGNADLGSNASYYPKLETLLEEIGLFQQDETTGPVFFRMDYAGMALGPFPMIAIHAVVFSNFKVDPILPENAGDNYVSSVIEDVSVDGGVQASDAKNNTSLNAQISQTLTTTYSGSVTSEVNGSSSYTLGNTISIGAEPAFPLIGAISFQEQFSMSKEVQNGWSESEAHSQETAAQNEVSVQLPPYTGVLIKQTKKTKKILTKYNCPVSVSYRVRTLDYAYYRSGGSQILADIGMNARSDLNQRAIIDVGHIDRNGINWRNIRSDTAVDKAVQAMAANVPISSTMASFTESLSTVEGIIDRQMPLLPLKSIAMKNQSDEVELKAGGTLRVDSITLEGLNEKKSPYYGFDSDNGKWVLIDESGKELTDGSIAKLAGNTSTGRVTLTAVAPGTVYLKYLIDENKYGTLNNPETYAKNADLTKTALIEVKIKEKETTEATEPTQTGSMTEPTLPKDAVSPENPTDNKTNEKAVLAAKNDKDTKGSTFSLLQAKGVAKSKTSVKLSWKKVPGARSYVIYGSPCGSGIKKIKTVKGTSYTQKKLKKGKYYKYVIAAVNGGNTLATSKTIHVATKGGKVGNNTSVKLNKTKLTLKAGASSKVTAKLKAGKLKVRIHRRIAWESGNISVATVKNGKIKGVKAGTCYIYAYAQNGVTAKVKVTIK